MIIVDNNPISFLLNTQNGIEVPSFFGDPDDCYLMDTLLGKLQKCAVADDVRDVIIMNEWD